MPTEPERIESAKPGRSGAGWLIRGLLAIAVIGIVVAILVPAPANYVPMKKVDAVHRAAMKCAGEVARFLAVQKRLPADAGEAGCAQPASEYVSKLEVSRNRVAATMRGVTRETEGRSIWLLAVDETGSPIDEKRAIASWRCGTDAPSGEWMHFPRECRQSQR